MCLRRINCELILCVSEGYVFVYLYTRKLGMDRLFYELI